MVHMPLGPVLVPEVENQGEAPTCWHHALMVAFIILVVGEVEVVHPPIVMEAGEADSFTPMSTTDSTSKVKSYPMVAMLVL